MKTNPDAYWQGFRDGMENKPRNKKISKNNRAVYEAGYREGQSQRSRG